MSKNKKEKLAVLNTTLPFTLKDYAERTSKERYYSSTSDYIRSLIREDKDKSDSDELNQIINLIHKYFSKIFMSSKINTEDQFELLNKKLKTVSHLFDLGSNLRENKIKRENPDLNKEEVSKLLQEWAFDSSSVEVPGLIEESEERKRRLLSE